MSMRALAWTLLVTCTIPLDSAPVRADDDALRWLPPRVKGGGIVLLPKAYYSSENGFGAGLEAVRPYRFPGSTAADRDSEIRAQGRFNVDGHGAAEVEVTAHLGAGRWSTKAKAGYDALALRFWGVGSNTPSAAEETYRPQNVWAYVEIFHRVVGGLQAGLRAEWQDYRYLEVEEGGLLDTGAYAGTPADHVLGSGAVLEWDSRDDRYAPTRGIHAQAFWLWFGGDASDFEFSNGHLDLRSYFDLGDDNVLAVQAFTYALFGDAPLWRFASVGGRAHSRGYRRDRFLERRMAALQAEWRRPASDHIDVVVFGGVANVARRYDTFTLASMRPTLGGGLRVHPRGRRDLMMRLDLAAGEESVRTYLSFGHAF